VSGYRHIEVSDETLDRVIGSHRRRLKDPHTGCELALMERGGKPMAMLFDKWRLGQFDDRFVKRRIKTTVGWSKFVVFRPEQSCRAEMLQRTFSMYERGLISYRVANDRIGLLLGYTKTQIRQYGERLDGMMR
jgi:hypothetical protein